MMRKISLLIFFLLFASVTRAQLVTPTLILSSDPSGACPNGRLAVNITTSTFFYCAGSVWNQGSATGGGGGIASLNGLTTGTQIFSVGTTGTDINIISDINTHTFNVTDASCTIRGVVNDEVQVFCGNKTFGNDVVINGDLFVDQTLTLTPSDCDVESTDGQLCYNSDNTLYLNGIPLLPEPTTTSLTQLLSGGGVGWVSNLNFTVSAATYMIGGTQYSSSQTNVTLSASDPADARIDVFAVDDTGSVVVIEGTPSTPPAKPAVDPTTQVELSFATVAAGATTPTGVAVDNVYLENTEWTCTEVSAIGAFNCASTTNPHAGTKDVEATAVGKDAYVNFAKGSSIALSTYNNLVFWIRSKATWSSQRSLVITARLSGAAVGSAVTIRQGSFGFDSSNTTSYQQVVVPTFAFGLAGLIDTLRFTVVGGGASTIGFYLDNVILQGGLTTQIETNPYDIIFSLPNLPDDGEVYPILTFTRNVSFAGNFSSSRGTVGTNPTGAVDFTVSKNGSSIGTVHVTTGGVVSFTTTGAAPVNFIGGDRLTITAPTPQDATLADVAFTISGTR